MSKTPFEIRLEVLQMAKEYLDKVHTTNVEFAKDAFYKTSQIQNITVEEAKKLIEQFIPAQYTTDELMKQAQAMYAFIMKKD